MAIQVPIREQGVTADPRNPPRYILGRRLRKAQRKEARKLLSACRDPRHAFIRSQLLGDTTGSKSFEVLARESYDLRQPRWKPIHAKDVITRPLERSVNEGREYS